LKDVKEIVEHNVANMSRLHEKLGMPFLQMHDNFGPKDFDRVVAFAENWTYEVPLAIEFRHTDWYNDAAVSSELYDVLETHGVTLVDAPAFGTPRVYGRAIRRAASSPIPKLPAAKLPPPNS